MLVYHPSLLALFALAAACILVPADASQSRHTHPAPKKYGFKDKIQEYIKEEKFETLWEKLAKEDQWNGSKTDQAGAEAYLYAKQQHMGKLEEYLRLKESLKKAQNAAVDEVVKLGLRDPSWYTQEHYEKHKHLGPSKYLLLQLLYRP